MVWKAPSAWTANILRHSSSGVSWKRSFWAMPALFTSSAMGPRASTACSIAALTAARSATSAWTAKARPPWTRISAARSSAAARDCR